MFQKELRCGSPRRQCVYLLMTLLSCICQHREATAHNYGRGFQITEGRVLTESFRQAKCSKRHLLPNGTFHLENVGIVYILSQTQSGLEIIIGYFSTTLSKSEKNFHVTRREKSVEHFYLHGRKFLLWMDALSLNGDRDSSLLLGSDRSNRTRNSG